MCRPTEVLFRKSAHADEADEDDDRAHRNRAERPSKTRDRDLRRAEEAHRGRRGRRSAAPPEIRLVSPRATYSVPSVMMKGCGRRSTVRPRPLTRPAGDADQRPDQDDDRPRPAGLHRRSPATSWRAPCTEPTERSMPAVRMTTNMPERQQRVHGDLLEDVGEVVRATGRIPAAAQ